MENQYYFLDQNPSYEYQFIQPTYSTLYNQPTSTEIQEEVVQKEDKNKHVEKVKKTVLSSTIHIQKSESVEKSKTAERPKASTVARDHLPSSNNTTTSSSFSYPYYQPFAENSKNRPYSAYSNPYDNTNTTNTYGNQYSAYSTPSTNQQYTPYSNQASTGTNPNTNYANPYAGYVSPMTNQYNPYGSLTPTPTNPYSAYTNNAQNTSQYGSFNQQQSYNPTSQYPQHYSSAPNPHYNAFQNPNQQYTPNINYDYASKPITNAQYYEKYGLNVNNNTSTNANSNTTQPSGNYGISNQSNSYTFLQNDYSTNSTANKPANTQTGSGYSSNQTYGMSYDYNKSNNTTGPTTLQTSTQSNYTFNPTYSMPPSSTVNTNTSSNNNNFKPSTIQTSSNYTLTSNVANSSQNINTLASNFTNLNIQNPDTDDNKKAQLQEVMIQSEYGKVIRAKEFVDDPNSKYNTLLNSLKASGKKFIDTEFPADMNSLGYSDTFNQQDIIWCRPDQFYGIDKYKMYEGGVSVEDIKQGQLGDCYFLCVLSALAEWPHRIEKLIVNKEINEQGCYAIRINDLGEWQEIIVDDQFPCWADDRTLSFAKGNGMEMWVILLEKAWAKLFGSYGRIESGVATEALRNLTGAPTKFFYLADLDAKEKEDLWKEMLEGEKKNFVMTCSSPCADGLTDKDDRDGIFWGHAYSLLSAHEIHNNGQKVRLVRLRNPHSHGEWVGAWSDESPIWTPEAKEQVKWSDEDDGTFFMSWEDFFEYFEDFQICKVHDDYHYNSMRIEDIKPLERVYFKITIEQEGHYYISISQENKRHYPESEEYTEGDIFMVLAQKVGNAFKEIDKKYLAKREIWVQHSRLKPGDYWVFARPEWCDNKNHPMVLSTYGPTDTAMAKVDEYDCREFAEFTKRYKFS